MIPLFYSTLMLAFVYSITRLSSEHTQNRHTRLEGEGKGDDN